MMFALAPLMLLGAAPAATDHRPIGRETTIPFADRHGLRNWEAGPSRDLLYVQDNRGRWYQVKLSGPCVDDLGSLTLGYTTSPVGNFDTFSRVFSTDYPHRTCGVLSIKTSLPPPDHRKQKNAAKTE